MTGLRITGGTHRGRVVPGPKGGGVRPTSGRVREALFSMLGQDLGGCTVLDAFGGTGLLGFEASSRGARATVVEIDRALAKRVLEAARTLGLDVEVRRLDASHALASGAWDVVILDPPYDHDPAAWAARAAPAARAVLVVEHRKGAAMPDRLGALALDRQRTYGDSALTVYRPALAESGEGP